MSKIRECFKSRWPNGYIMEADFSQLEVIGLAFLTQDANLYEDILDGLDMHCINASFLYGYPYEAIKALVDAGNPEWVKKRKISKAPGFLIQYGGGANAMAKQTGLSMEQCKQFISNYYARYTGVGEWQDAVADEVRRSRKPSAKRTEKNLPAGMGQYKSITGRRYVFKEYDAPEWMARKGAKTSFSPTQMKNYPVQGFATGDVVPLVIGELYDVLKNSVWKDTALLTNTVHDSVLLDCYDRATAVQVAEIVKVTMERAPQYIEETWGFKFDLPLNVDVEIGETWAKKKKLDL